MKLAPNPIISAAGTAGNFIARASGKATGAIMRMVTTLSTNERYDARQERKDDD